MAKITLPISQGFYVSDALPISNQRCVNYYPNVPQSNTVTADNLFLTPGLVELVEASASGVIRGSHVMAGIPYFVVGASLYRLNLAIVSEAEVFTVDNLGVIDGQDRVYIADNGTQLCVVAVPDASTVGVTYIFTESPDTLVVITDVNFDGPAASVVFVDGFFVFHKSDGKKFFNSPLNNGLGPYDPLDFSSAEGDPDQIRALPVLRNQLYVIGSETTEIFRNIGRAPSPFQRMGGGFIDVGVVAPQSVAIFAGSIAFVGAGVSESPAVWTIIGGGKKKISTTAIDNELSKLTEDEAQNIFSWVYSESGAFFYGITLPDTCFVFDATNQRWHERQSTKGTDITQYRAGSMVQAYGRILVGDLQSGIIGALDENVYLEYNRLIRRLVTSKPFDNQGDPLFVAAIEAVVESGVGLANDVIVSTGTTAAGDDIEAIGGSDPQITLSWSDDGGRTFVGFLSRSMGKLGAYNQRSIWRRLGRFPRSRVLAFGVASPTKSTIIKIEADIG